MLLNFLVLIGPALNRTSSQDSVQSTKWRKREKGFLFVQILTSLLPQNLPNRVPIPPLLPELCHTLTHQQIAKQRRTGLLLWFRFVMVHPLVWIQFFPSKIRVMIATNKGEWCWVDS